MGLLIIAAITTEYNGIEFRSKLEANIAKLLDACKVRWIYEGESFNLDGVLYLPDFFLPDAKQFVEAKGTADDPSVEKCERLARALRVVWGDDDEWSRRAAVVVLAPPFLRLHLGPANEVSGFGFNGQVRVDAVLATCSLCGVRFFSTHEQDWSCTACLKNPGNPHPPVLVRSKHRRGVTTFSEI